MKILNIDLDNTLIYSYKHNIGKEKINVEVYQERQISFITEKTQELLQLLKEKILIVPTTTRTQEQYERINLQIGKMKYALICNGGILLQDGERNLEWLDESRKLIKDSMEELRKGKKLLEEDSRRIFEVRFIEELFIFTKCNFPEEITQDLKKCLDSTLVDIYNHGSKVYIVPMNLDKGTAIRRFRKKFRDKMGNTTVYAAGDSEFDCSMIEAADFGIVPHGFQNQFRPKANIANIIEMSGKGIFSDELLDYLKGAIIGD